MASTITITCPECEKQLKASSEVLGKKIRCKGCGATFSAKTTKEKPAPKKPGKEAPAKANTKPAGKPAGKPAHDDEEDANPYGMTEEYLGRRCPECANAMEDEDVICLECGYNTTTREKARTRKIRDVTGFDTFMWLLPGILCALLCLIVLGLIAWYWVGVSKEDFGVDVWYDFLGGMGMKVYATLMVLFTVYKAGRFAVIRLCINYKVPEEEVKSKVQED